MPVCFATTTYFTCASMPSWAHVPMVSANGITKAWSTWPPLSMRCWKDGKRLVWKGNDTAIRLCDRSGILWSANSVQCPLLYLLTKVHIFHRTSKIRCIQSAFVISAWKHIHVMDLCSSQMFTCCMRNVLLSSFMFCNTVRHARHPTLQKHAKQLPNSRNCLLVSRWCTFSQCITSENRAELLAETRSQLKLAYTPSCMPSWSCLWWDR